MSLKSLSLYIKALYDVHTCTVTRKYVSINYYCFVVFTTKSTLFFCSLYMNDLLVHVTTACYTDRIKRSHNYIGIAD